MADVLTAGLILSVFLTAFRIVFAVSFVSGIPSESNVLGPWRIINSAFSLILVSEVSYMMNIINRKLVKYKTTTLFSDPNRNINFFHFIYLCFDHLPNFFWLKVKREKNILATIVRGWSNFPYLWFPIAFLICIDEEWCHVCF